MDYDKDEAIKIINGVSNTVVPLLENFLLAIAMRHKHLTGESITPEELAIAAGLISAMTTHTASTIAAGLDGTTQEAADMFSTLNVLADAAMHDARTGLYNAARARRTQEAETNTVASKKDLN